MPSSQGQSSHLCQVLYRERDVTGRVSGDLWFDHNKWIDETDGLMLSRGLNMGVFTVSLLLIAVFSLGDAAARPLKCHKGWHKFGSHCFNFDTTPRSWTDAEKHCQSLAGHLASIHSKEESTFLEKLAGGSTITWIGGNDGGRPEMTQHRTWTWTDGSWFNYQNWAEGEPNNYNGVREPCIQMNFGDKHSWNDEVCEKLFASICSRSHQINHCCKHFLLE